MVLEENGCQPTPSGEVEMLQSTYSLYDLGESMNWQQLKKTVSFWSNIHKGNTRLKLRFFANKILRTLGMQKKAVS